MCILFGSLPVVEEMDTKIEIRPFIDKHGNKMWGVYSCTKKTKKGKRIRYGVHPTKLKAENHRSRLLIMHN